MPASAIAWTYKRIIQRDDGTIGDRYRRYMSSGDPDFEPSPISRYHAFISYSFEDDALALELADALNAEGLTSFLASRDMRSGQLWQEETASRSPSRVRRSFS
jgi:TIR domain